MSGGVSLSDSRSVRGVVGVESNDSLGDEEDCI
jgi:hypothetical protein